MPSPVGVARVCDPPTFILLMPYHGLDNIVFSQHSISPFNVAKAPERCIGNVSRIYERRSCWHNASNHMKRLTMPKGPQGQKRPPDAAGCVVRVAKVATGEIEENLEHPSRQPNRAKGRTGWVRARAAALSLRERTEIAFSANARWGKGNQPLLPGCIMRQVFFVLILLSISGPALASDCSQIRDPEVQMACVLQGLRMQMPSLPGKEAPQEVPKEDEFYRKELYEYVFRPCALRDAARVNDAKGLDYAVDIVIAAFHADSIEAFLPTLRGEPWTKRVLSYYSLLHVCLMTPR